MMVWPRVYLCASAAVMMAFPALAGESDRLLESGAWKAYAYTDTMAGGQICYAAANADRMTGGEKDRPGSALVVTHRPKAPGEVSLIAPYGLKAGGENEIQIGGLKYSFFGKVTSAWAKDSVADASIITALLKNREVIAKVVPTSGSAITDIIPLKGFPEALAAIDKACAVKR